jgi:hypothetical protein
MIKRAGWGSRIAVRMALCLAVAAVAGGLWFGLSPISAVSTNDCGTLLSPKYELTMEGSMIRSCQDPWDKDAVVMRRWETGASAVAALWLGAVAVGLRRRNITLMHLNREVFATA